MLVHFAYDELLVLAPVVIGMLTLFGRKKKEEKVGESQKDVPALPAPQTMAQQGVEDRSGTVLPGSRKADVSLNELLESMLNDLPPVQHNERDEGYKVPQSSPDWVPPRATPPSRPMVVVEGQTGRRLVDAERPGSTKGVLKHAELDVQHSIGAPEPRVSSIPKLAGLAEEVQRLEEEVKKKLEAPEKLERPAREAKQEKREPEKGPAGKGTQGFEQVLDLTGGALLSPGLVVVSGPKGSGKTTFCSNLVGTYLQRGGPCFLVSYDQSPVDTRAALEKVGCDPSEYESQFRFFLVDGFSAESEGFSLEPYCVEKPFEFASLQETLVRNVQLFAGERVGVVLDSLDGFLSRFSAKEFLKGLREISDKLKASGATFVVTAGSDKLPKDLAEPLDDLAGCLIDLEVSGSKGGRFRVRKLNGSAAKSDSKTFEFDPAKGLVFV